MIVVDEFTDLIFQIDPVTVHAGLDHGPVVRSVPRRIVRVVPVEYGIVRAEHHPLAPAFIRQLPEYVPAKGGRCDLVVGVFCVPQTEPVMVL